MYKPVILARSKLKNFAPKILLCVQLIVLSIRNANIVSDGKASELGVLNFELQLTRQTYEAMASRRSHAPTHSRITTTQLWDKHHLFLYWFRKAGLTIILNIIREVSVPLRGTIYRWMYLMYPQLRSFAACSGFLMVGPAPRNLQLILNQSACCPWVRGYGETP